MSRPPGSPFPERYEAVLAMKLDGRTNRQIKAILGLNRNQLSSVISQLREKGRLERSGPKISRPRSQPLHKAKSPPGLTPAPANGVLISDLEPNCCKFAVGTDKAGNNIFCAAQTDGLSSWCSAHTARVYQPR